MVIRLFTPPGEGQHRLVPKRPDPLGANATLQYSVLSSTCLAAAYTTFASRFGLRTCSSPPASTTARFVRSSARLGLWAGAVGVAVNCYYFTSFTNIVILQKNSKVKPWKLYKWTKRFTVEDGILVGTGLGLAASLFTRRLAVPWWTRAVGMANVGAATGVVGAHGYLEYIGERQRAYKRLNRRLKRRSLEFWAIFWDKELMALFDPVIQQYIRHNGIWYTQLLPDTVYDRPDDYGRKPVKQKSLDGEAALQPQEEAAYYNKPFDYAHDLEQINVEQTLSKMEELEDEKERYLTNATYLLFINAQKQRRYCHAKKSKTMDDDELGQLLQEIHLVEIAFNRLRSSADGIDVKLTKWRISLQHKAIWCATEDTLVEDSVETWLPKSKQVDFSAHDPSVSIVEIEKFATQIGGEVKRFEDLVTHQGYSQQRRDRWRKDLEDGRVLLRAADQVVYELEQVRKALEGQQALAQRDGSKEATVDDQSLVAADAAKNEGGKDEGKAQKQDTEATDDEKGGEQSRVGKGKKAKPLDDGLESN